MNARQLARSLFMRLMASDTRRAFVRRRAETHRRLSGSPHRVDYFHQVDDPYSHLAAQALAPLVEQHAIEIVPHLVAPPDDAAAPERPMLEAFARRDAADIAPHFGVSFRDPGAPPEPVLVETAQRVLAGALASARFGSLATRVGDALWSRDATAMDKLAAESTPADTTDTKRRLEEGTQSRAALGHYLGATFHYGGEWYWGVDRLGHLETRLFGLGTSRVRTATPRFAPPSEDCAARGAAQLTLEFFPSLRSPYTYLAMPRVISLCEATGVQLDVRPVLPMVMRGLPVPMPKGAYIMMDVAREADRLGLDFGRIIDPVGRPVERAYSLFDWARSHGKGAAWLHACARGAFAGGLDTGRDSVLRRLCAELDLPFDEASDALDSEDWRGEVETHRGAMYEAGLWGVPSFRLRGPAGEPDYATWGQDRLFRIAQEIDRRTA